MAVTKEDIKELLIFTKGEKKGIIVLIILIILVIIFNQFSYLFYEEKPDDFDEFKKEITEFEKTLIPKENSNNNISYFDKKYDTLKFFKFNPNTISQEEWQQLGLSDKQIKTIKNYLNKVGKFKYKTDLQKIYGLSDKQFQKLYPFINLPEKENYSQNKVYEKSDSENYNRKKSNYNIPDVTEYFEFNPNEISETQWKKLGFSERQILTIKNYLNKGGRFYKPDDLKKIYGIQEFQFERIKEYIKIPTEENKSEFKIEEIKHQKVDINNLSIDEMKKMGKFWQYYATRIVKYRNLLGGYYKKEQLLEVYGVKKHLYDEIVDDVIIDKSKLEKININFAEVSELGRHPYISYEDAKKVLDFRNKNGFIKDINILKEKKIIPANVYEKISPYIKVK